ncbi:MAG: ABC transporter permease [Chitinophagaceae bacterium]|nr:ABC transporter permease [Chitinophagaceae bacterium]MBK8311598.1 ABC transporter permease [Chitinophagaceae bacterium]MBP6477342.1 ABC transporter permease [Chitinophagaceae bacterium]MBP7107550.1 ABC transporter permease [Chitinophagaceae bacterium]MBP7315135.1 ABC transporter permease [Chitinophagaceae bacterium]
MLKFIIKKSLYGLLVLVGVVVLVFFLFQGFGDPSRLVMGQSGDSATQANIKKELYLDQPKWKQFVYYLNDVSPICFHSKSEIEKKKLKGFFIGGETKFGIKVPYLRTSYQTKRPVWNVLMQALPGTLMLAIAAMVIAILIGIPLGVMAAVKQNTWLDTSAIFSSIVGISAPSFFTGIIMVYIFGFVLSDWTGLHIAGNWFVIDDDGNKRLTMQNLILPAVTLGIRPLAIITQLTRSAMLDVLDQDYIRTAYAKGLSKRQVIWKHGLRNALNPVITAITGWFAELLAGAFFVEYIFGWQGIGKVTVDALEKLDYPVVMGSVLVAATFFILINILADILYGVVDPRVRVE